MHLLAGSLQRLSCKGALERPVLRRVKEPYNEGRHKGLLLTFQASLSVSLVAHACGWHHLEKVAVVSVSNLMTMFQDARCLEAVARA